MLELVTTKRGKEALKYGSNIYTFDKRCKSYNSWRCRLRGCPGRIQTNFENSQIINIFNHSHNEITNEISAENIYQKMIDIGKLQNIDFDECLRESQRSLGCIFPSTKSVVCLRKRYVKFMRDFKNPPTNMSSILDIYKYTYDNRCFLQHDTGENDTDRIMIFSTSNFISYMQKCKIIMSDGTFYAAPAKFGQVYIIHGFFCNNTIPLAWCLLKNKKKESYCKLFQYFKDKIALKPTHWITDFESAPVLAIEQHFSDIKVQGCWFHYCQINLRWLQKNNMLNRYKTDPAFMLIFKKLMLICFFPEEDIKRKVDEIGAIITDTDLQMFFNFFKGNFILNERKCCTKQIRFWSTYDRIKNDIPTTTNSCEAYHKHLNAKTERSNAKFEKFVNTLKREEDRIQRKVNNLLLGIDNFSKKNNERRKNIVLNYEYYDTDMYFDALLCYCTLPMINK